MFWFKQCPRCCGDLYQDRDHYGPFVSCCQCGFSKDLPSAFEGVLEVSAEPVPAPVIPQEEGGRRRRISHGGRHFARTFAFATRSESDPATSTVA